MKLVDRTLTTINDGSLKIEEAIGQAANEIASEVSALPLKVEALLKEMGQSFQAIANQLAEIPSLINPVPIVAPLPEQMANSSLRLRDILAQAAQIPVNLVSLAGNTQGVTAQVGQATQALEGLPSQLINWVPDVPTQLKPLNDLASKALATIEKADTAKDLTTPFIEQTAALSAELKGIELTLKKLADSGVRSPAITDPLKSREAIVKAEIQSQFDALHQQIEQLKAELSKGVTGMRNTVEDVEKALMGELSHAKEMIQAAATQALSPLQSAKAFTLDFQSKVQEEATHCEILFDQAQKEMEETLADLRNVIDQIRKKLNDMGDRLTQTGIETQALIDQSLKPIDQLKDTADACVDSVERAVSVIDEQIDAVKINLDDLSQEAEMTKSKLRELPNEFSPVRDYIEQASEEIESIKSQIPGFVSQAISALGVCSEELEQADGLCDNAIDICTRHMAIAPPLAMAKTLFQGVKANLVPLQSSITAAEQMVTASGNAATSLMDQALSVVLALDPLLDQVLDKMHAAIDSLLDLITKLQQGIELAKSALDRLMDEINATVSEIRSQLDELNDSVHRQAQGYLEKIQLQSTIDGLLDKLDELSASMIDPLDVKLNQANGSIASFVQDAQTKLQITVSALGTELDHLVACLDHAHEMALNQVNTLDDQFDLIQSHWDDIEAKADTRIQNTLDYMDGVTDQALSRAAADMGLQWTPAA